MSLATANARALAAGQAQRESVPDAWDEEDARFGLQYAIDAAQESLHKAERALLDGDMDATQDHMKSAADGLLETL